MRAGPLQFRLFAFCVLFLSSLAASAGTSAAPKETKPKVSPREAQEFFRSLDSILQFVSDDTGLPIKHPVKKDLAGRDEVEKSTNERMENDEDTKRLRRAEVVLKKFGFVPRDFDLQSFLVSLLREQVAGFYNTKNHTVYMLDWVDLAQQRPVMAHELTHALQDQNFNLQEWLKPRHSKDGK